MDEWCAAAKLVWGSSVVRMDRKTRSTKNGGGMPAYVLTDKEREI
jgi:hypothetical protein